MEAKKYPKADLNRFRVLFFNIGLIVSLGLVLTAFEWRFYDKGGLLEIGAVVDDNFDEIIEVPPTEQPPPPPPETKNINFVAINDEEELVDELEINFDIEMTEDLKIEQLPEHIEIDEVIEEERAEEVFVIVEEQPHPIGGFQAFYEHINSQIKYPSMARRMNIQGKVFVQFIVEKNGSISQVEVIRGLSNSCDEEAIRVVSSAPGWVPGKQRGKPVRVKMVLPISFRLR